ncbi:extracellular solute-binding protein [Saccharibacillus sp. CPCC 101409]|uniref:extracellular solute-binding protein n=1 Tax=Saccharibacillus sp. CPCC 101409 TaxID=3058041 RepID=UPI0026721C9A|nr:extracellular solute-binding protein [Saccharibacillus sp. CPCC 101409]MDO3411154.1 extracellular solute-binding protein [Saccharibacillus sp. CPCC 101409]
MRKNARVKAGLSAVLILSMLTTACGSKNAASGVPEDGKPLPVSIMSMYFTPEPPDAENVVLKEIEKRTNTDLNITWVSPNSYGDKVNVTLASGDIPDLMLVDDPFSAQMRTMVQQGAFWDLTPFIKDYPNLAGFPEETWINTKQADGNNYGIPRVRPVDGGSFLFLRQDWLDNLKLDVPQTTDEFYEVLRAFTEDDPDGNGKDDTIGFTGYVSQSNMGSYSTLVNAFTGTTGDWKETDGKLTNVNLLPEMRDALEWLQNAYKDGLISEDLAVLKESQTKDQLKAGHAGASQNTVEAAWEPMEEQLKTNPDADFLPLVSMNGYVNRDSGFFCMFVIPKSVPEAKMKKLLELMDYGASEEGGTLASYGLEGVHYTEENGIKTTTEQAKTDIVAQQALGQIFMPYDKYQRAYRVGMPQDILERNKKIIDERAAISIPDKAVGLYSETNVSAGPELSKEIQDMKTKVVLGKQSLSAWDDYVAKLKTNADLQKITGELNEAYAQRKASK